jgi:DNA-binding transcriptional MerR regulator
MNIKVAPEKKRGLMRISEVSRITGVSLPTIHYYVREGLLSPAVKTARNMAYYSPQCIEDIRLIKQLQLKRFLPLSAIKMMMSARQRGEDTNHLIEMLTFLDDIFHPVGRGELRSLTFHDLVNAAGMSAADLNELDEMGLLMPADTPQGRMYDDIDLRIAQIVSELEEFGFRPSDLQVYSQYIDAVRNEVKAIHEKVHQVHVHGSMSFPVARLLRTLAEMKSCLSQKIFREIVVGNH